MYSVQIHTKQKERKARTVPGRKGEGTLITLFQLRQLDDGTAVCNSKGWIKGWKSSGEADLA